MQHQLWSDFLVEFFRSQESKRNSRLLERCALFVGLLGAFGNIYESGTCLETQLVCRDARLTVIAHMAIENGGKHQRLMEQGLNALLICLDADNAVLGK